MAAECPVCRKSVPWHRLFRTTAWGKWRCNSCDSLLTVDVRWRFVTLGLAMALMFAVTRVVRTPLAWDLPVVLIVMSAVMIPYFLFFERARVLERCGFRCQDCGYDLRGQIAARCSECGRDFNADEVAWMQQSYSAGQPRGKVQRRTVVGLVMLIPIFLTTVLAVVGTARFGLGRNIQKALNPKVVPTPVAPPTNPAP